jgi:hypothetical protein
MYADSANSGHSYIHACSHLWIAISSFRFWHTDCYVTMSPGAWGRAQGAIAQRIAPRAGGLRGVCHRAGRRPDPVANPRYGPSSSCQPANVCRTPIRGR